MPDFDEELRSVLTRTRVSLPPAPKPPEVEFEEQSIVGAIPGAVGKEVLDFLRDAADIPRRILSTITRQPEQIARVRIMQQRVGVLKKSGLSDQQARQQILQEFHEGKLPEISGTINPDEAAAALDIAFLGIPLGKVAQPLRIAVSGTTVSPAIFETLAILGRETVVNRITRCLACRQQFLDKSNA